MRLRVGLLVAVLVAAVLVLGLLPGDPAPDSPDDRGTLTSREYRSEANRGRPTRPDPRLPDHDRSDEARVLIDYASGALVPVGVQREIADGIAVTYDAPARR